MEEQSPIIEAKATADYCANDYLNTEMSTLVKDYGYAYADDATLQGIIDSYIQNIPEEILETLVNLKNVSQPIKIIDTLLPEHIITPRLEILMENLHHFNIKIKTRQNAQAEILGYLIIDLNNNKHAIVRFDTENKIQEMRFEHIDAGKINVLLKLTCPEIETCNLKDFSEILY